MPVHLQREIESLKQMILSLGALVEQRVHDAIRVVDPIDVELATKLVADDVEVDLREVQVEEACLKALALHQPVAGDLRFIVALLKINNDLERIGDLAVNIAERAIDLAGRERAHIPFDFREMAEKTKAMLQTSLDALVNLDVVAARSVCASDHVVDAINRQVQLEAARSMEATPARAQAWIDAVSISHSLERIADLATNIAEDVIYMVEGEIVRHRGDAAARPRAAAPENGSHARSAR